MAKTFSTMLPLGTYAPDFSLVDTEGKRRQLKDFQDSKGYLIMFICNHCPYVVHIREAMLALAHDLEEQGFTVLAINSNDPIEYPEDNLSQMKIFAKEFRYSFPYLFDETQEVAKAYQAACTPDFFLFDERKHLVYRGQMDASRPGNKIHPDGSDIRKAADALCTDVP